MQSPAPSRSRRSGSVAASPGPGKSPRDRANQRWLREMCIDLVSVLGIEPTEVFFTEERTRALKDHSAAIEELSFFYDGVVRAVLQPSLMNMRKQELPMPGVILYRETCQALYRLRILPLPDPLEWGDPSPVWLTRVAERTIAYFNKRQSLKTMAVKYKAQTQALNEEQRTIQAKLSALQSRKASFGNVESERAKVAEHNAALRDKITETYKRLQTGNTRVHSFKKKNEELKVEITLKEHELVELQSHNESLESSLVQSPQRCISELDRLRQTVAEERAAFEEESTSFNLARSVTMAAADALQAMNQLRQTSRTRSERLIAKKEAEQNEIEALQAVKEAKEDIQNWKNRTQATIRDFQMGETERDSKLSSLRQERVDLHARCQEATELYHHRLQNAEEAHSSLQSTQMEGDRKNRQLQALKDRCSHELTDAFEMCSNFEMKIRHHEDNLIRVARERSTFQNMTWDDFKRLVQTAQVGSPETSTEQENDPCPGRKSVDVADDFDQAPPGNLRRRRSSLQAAEHAEELRIEAGVNPTVLPEGEIERVRFRRMSPQERMNAAQQTFWRRIEQVVSGESLTVDERKLRMAIPKTVMALLKKQLELNAHVPSQGIASLTL